MICVSITDLIPESINLLRDNINNISTIIISFLGILLGIIISMLIDYYLPDKPSISSDKKLYKVAQTKDIKLGNATILTVLKDKNIGEYDIKITKINDTSNNTKNILFEITDQELLKETGGIVQGMSGSPIIQGEYIVGAVTHVVIDNPSTGYGIFITNMLEESEK